MHNSYQVRGWVGGGVSLDYAPKGRGGGQGSTKMIMYYISISVQQISNVSFQMNKHYDIIVQDLIMQSLPEETYDDGDVPVMLMDDQKMNKLGLSWGSTRRRQLAWSSPTKLNIGLNIEFHIRLNNGFNIGFNIGVQYWV